VGALCWGRPWHGEHLIDNMLNGVVKQLLKQKMEVSLTRVRNKFLQVIRDWEP
jgi:hypothetical protein